MKSKKSIENIKMDIDAYQIMKNQTRLHLVSQTRELSSLREKLYTIEHELSNFKDSPQLKLYKEYKKKYIEIVNRMTHENVHQVNNSSHEIRLLLKKMKKIEGIKEYLNLVTKSNKIKLNIEKYSLIVNSLKNKITDIDKKIEELNNNIKNHQNLTEQGQNL